MIVIDRNIPVQNIILTLTESTTINEVNYVMILKCDATRSEYQIILPENISISTSRYDLFQISNMEFENMETGYYSYSIYQQDADTKEIIMIDSIEDGKLLIKGVIPADAEDYIIYRTEE